MIASAPHGPGPFPPASNVGGGMVGRAALNPLNYSPAVRALFRALDRWVVDDVAPPPSAYPQIADGTLTPPDRAGWPAVPGFQLPQQPLRAFHLNFGPDWAKGIVSVEPPEVGKPFVVRVPAVDADGNVRAGIRLPDIAVPLATQAGWNYRDASIGAPDRLAGEIGSYIPFARTTADRERRSDPRLSIEERYRNPRRVRRQVRRRALDLVERGYLLAGGRGGPAETRGRALRLGDAAEAAPPTNDPPFHHCALACLAAVLPACVRRGEPFTADPRDQGLRGVADHRKLDGKGQTDGMLARVNALREEPGGANRLLRQRSQRTAVHPRQEDEDAHDLPRLQRPRGSHRTLPPLAYETGYANGLVSFQFDPGLPAQRPLLHRAYRRPGGRRAGRARQGEHCPVSTCAATRRRAAIATPGDIQREGVLIEWTDTNIGNTTFEGTARELLRLQLNTRIHPLGDLVFNPAARPGDAGLARALRRLRRRRLGRIAAGHPDQPAAARYDGRQDPPHHPGSRERTTSSVVSENGRYRIPNDNPFVATPGARPEIWAYGFRNPHRLTLAIDPQTPANNRLIANSIGLTRGKRSTSFTRARTTATRCAKAPRRCSRTTRRRSVPRSTRFQSA